MGRISLFLDSSWFDTVAEYAARYCRDAFVPDAAVLGFDGFDGWHSAVIDDDLLLF